MRTIIILTSLLLCFPSFGKSSRIPQDVDKEPLNLLVMDPLAAQLACACVAGYAQRDYAQLAGFIEKKSGRPITVSFSESLTDDADLVIGKYSVVKADAATLQKQLRTVAMLSDKKGEIHQTGLFVVRANDPAKGIGDIEKYRLLFGPEDCLEKQGAALASLEAFAIPSPREIKTNPSCGTTALAVIENETDCGVISSYAMPLLEGCGTIEKGELRIIGKTDPVPFVAVFAAPTVDQKTVDALFAVKDNSILLEALESKDGFIPLPPEFENSAGWPDWRGVDRAAISKDVPQKLPAKPRLLWSRIMTGHGMAGVSAANGRVVVADKDMAAEKDIFHCLDADSGREYWRIEYPAIGEMDFTNSPRANPLIHNGRVYLLGAFGDLVCADLMTGKIYWRKNMVADFGAELPTWGFCSTPLIDGEKLIINPGAPDASIVALYKTTGKALWKTAGERPGYSSFIAAAPNGVRQIIGYDAVSVGGWDPATGKRLWELVPQEPGDFNVPTPILVNERLLLSTENNGTRLHGFDKKGILDTNALFHSEELNPDTSSLVVHNGLIFGNWSGLVCLDAKDLKLNWAVEDGPLTDYSSFIAGNKRLLASTQTGKLILAEASPKAFKIISELDLFPDVSDTEKDVWSHPALVGNRLYIRNSLAVYCFLLD